MKAIFINFVESFSVINHFSPFKIIYWGQLVCFDTNDVVLFLFLYRDAMSLPVTSFENLETRFQIQPVFPKILTQNTDNRYFIFYRLSSEFIETGAWFNNVFDLFGLNTKIQNFWIIFTSHR